MKTFNQFMDYIDQTIINDSEDYDYRGSHRAPSRKFENSPLHNVSPNTYPEDFHSKDGFRIYADTGTPSDRESYNIIRNVRNKPDEPVVIYRAVPRGGDHRKEINPGDWVTGSLTYAKLHGNSVLGRGKFKILKKSVPAKHLYTDGNSVNEFGYDPSEENLSSKN